MSVSIIPVTGKRHATEEESRRKRSFVYYFILGLDKMQMLTKTGAGVWSLLLLGLALKNKEE